jgi:hypothetical protein
MKFHRGEIISGPDKMGRYTFFLYWMADYHPGDPQGEYRHAERGQIFFADPNEWKDVVEKWVDLRHLQR